VDKLTISVSEAAEVLGISRGKAYEQVSSGCLPSIRVGRRILIPKHSVSEFLGRKTEESFRIEAKPQSPQPSKQVRWSRILDEFIVFLRFVREGLAD